MGFPGADCRVYRAHLRLHISAARRPDGSVTTQGCSSGRKRKQPLPLAGSLASELPLRCPSMRGSEGYTVSAFPVNGDTQKNQTQIEPGNVKRCCFSRSNTAVHSADTRVLVHVYADIYGIKHVTGRGYLNSKFRTMTELCETTRDGLRVGVMPLW